MQVVPEAAARLRTECRHEDLFSESRCGARGEDPAGEKAQPLRDPSPEPVLHLQAAGRVKNF